MPEVDFSSDPDDNIILATAIAGSADLIVSGDKPGMLALNEVEGIKIVTPREALVFWMSVCALWTTRSAVSGAAGGMLSSVV